MILQLVRYEVTRCYVAFCLSNTCVNIIVPSFYHVFYVFLQREDISQRRVKG